MPLTFPIVVAEGMDVSFYASEDAVDRQLESWYVKEDYRAFDAEGRKVVLRVEKRQVPRRWLPGTATYRRVIVEAAEDVPTHATELAELLREWLVAVGASRRVSAGSLGDLIEQAATRGEIHR